MGCFFFGFLVAGSFFLSFFTSLQALPFLPLLFFLDSQSCDECVIGVLPFCSDVERMVLCCTFKYCKKEVL